MADETTELTEATEVINGLSGPTDEQFMQALRGYSDTGVALAAAKLALAGGGAGGFSGWTEAGTPADVDSSGGTLTFTPDDPADYAVTFDYSGENEWVGAILVRVHDLAALADSSWVLHVVNDADAVTTFQLDAFGAATIQESPDGGSDSASWVWRAADNDVVFEILPGSKALHSAAVLELIPTDTADIPITMAANDDGAAFYIGGLGVAPTTLNELVTSLTTLGVVAP